MLDSAMNCPEEDELVNLVARRIPEPRAQQIRAHSFACEECGALLADLVRERTPDPVSPPHGHETTDLALAEPAASSERPAEHPLSPGQELAGRAVTAGRSGGHEGALTHFRIERLLGRGGMGEVYLATDTTLQRPVAIKFLGPSVATDPRVRARFARESLITARLQHPSIVSLYEIGASPTGDPFYVMRLVPGTSLADAIKKATTVSGRLALLPHLLATADALAYAHGQGIVHRDLKPANVLTGEFGETVVVDWGLAKDLRRGQGQDGDREPPDQPAFSDDQPNGTTNDNFDATRVGAVIGTPAYMSPEQAVGKPADERSDVYAIGAILYELLAQRPPYQGASGEATVQRVRSGPPRPLSELAPDAPADLCAIAQKAMARDPGDRYPSAQGLADELRRFQTGQLVSVHRYSARELVSRWVRRHRATVLVGALATTALAAVGIYSLVQVVRARDRAQSAEGLANTRAIAFEEAQGQQALVDGEPLTAAALLDDAYAQDARPAIRFLLAQAENEIVPVSATFATGDRLYGADLSPDQTQIAIGGDQGDVRILDARTGALVRDLGGAGSSDGPVHAVSFSPDGKRVLAGHQSRRATVWDAATGAVLLQLDEGTDEAIFSPDGKLIGGAANGQAVVWDAITGAKLLTVTAPIDNPHAIGESSIKHVAFDRTDTRLLTSMSNGSVRIWDVRTGAALNDLTGHQGMVNWVAFSADGKRVVTTGDDRSARVWDAATGTGIAILVGHRAMVTSAAFSPDGQLVATSSTDGTARLWDAQSGVLVGVAERESQTISTVEWSTDGKRLVTSSLDGNVRLWDVSSVHAPPTFNSPVQTGVNAMAVSPDGAHVALTCCVTRIWTPLSPTTPATPATDDTVPFATPFANAAGVAYSPDGTRLAEAQIDGPALAILDTATDRTVASLTGSVSPFAFDARGERLVTVDNGPTATVWDATTGKALFSLEGHSGPVTDAAFSADGTRIVTGSEDGTARLWDGQGGQALLTIQVGSLVRSAALSSDARRVVVAGSDSLAHVYDAGDGTTLATLSGHHLAINAARFSPDGTLVATGSMDRTARVWDADSGQLLRTFSDHLGGVIEVLFTPDGRHLVTASWDQTARMFDVHEEDRPADAVAAAIEAEVPFTLTSGRLIPNP
jgi:WD40 repeat protein/serine/threonine protein kinase